MAFLSISNNEVVDSHPTLNGVLCHLTSKSHLCHVHVPPRRLIGLPLNNSKLIHVTTSDEASKQKYVRMSEALVVARYHVRLLPESFCGCLRKDILGRYEGYNLIYEDDYYMDTRDKSVLSLLFLGVFHEGSQLTDLAINTRVKVEPILLAATDLKKVVVEGLLGNTHLSSCLLQGLLDVASLLVVESSVKPSPQGHFLHHLTDLFLLLFRTLLLLDCLLVGVLFLLLQQALDQPLLALPHLQL